MHQFRIKQMVGVDFPKGIWNSAAVRPVYVMVVIRNLGPNPIRSRFDMTVGGTSHFVEETIAVGEVFGSGGRAVWVGGEGGDSDAIIEFLPMHAPTFAP